MVKEIKAYSIKELEVLIKQLGLPNFRTHQIIEWLYSKKAKSYDDMTNLPKDLRETLKDKYPLYYPKIKNKQVSKDGSIKVLLELSDKTLIETVGIPYDDGRLTTCCSTQVGCGIGCIFCATGKQGFHRNLFPGEIVDQINIIQDIFNKRVTNVVLMGQGEPFLNYKSVIEALKIINNKKLIGIGARHITISTCGILKGIAKIKEEKEQYVLAISLHSAIQETRNKLMPTLKNQNLINLRKEIDLYIEKTGRRVTFEYALIKDINDSDKDLKALISLSKGLLCHINLIPLNKTAGSTNKSSLETTFIKWKKEIESNYISVSVRNSKGSDIDAACGQLVANEK